ncbi:MAG TPA: hypothetical protein VL688_09860 [Verrucomicrobiae bacterium]|jgi:hypothetical protein|nr:hypothetical protein [Verrucomicrobiae bacterium]
MKSSDRFKQLGFLGLLFYGLWGAGHPDFFGLLNGANLLFHEAGHLIFGLFGSRTLGILGGTVGQLVFPVGLTSAFWRRVKLASASVMAWWVGQNLANIGAYIADARDQVLPLVGDGTHDWHYLLAYFQVLPYDHSIGGCVWFAGILIMLGASICGFIFSDTGGESLRRPLRKNQKVPKPYKNRDKRDPYL